MQSDHQVAETGAVPWAHLRLPPFPQVAIRVLQLAGKKDVSMRQLSEVISSEPAFCSEVLTIANSLLYAPRYPVTSMLQAVAILGIHNLKGMCLTVGVRAYLGRALTNPVMRGIWRHNLATALIARELAFVGMLDRDTAYTAGLLHDLGRLAFAVLQPAAYIGLLEQHVGTSQSILAHEKSLFGEDHCCAGVHLVREWQLPSEFESVVREHHSDRKLDAWLLPDLVRVSCKMADAVGFPAFQGCEVLPYAELLDELPARERGLFSGSLNQLAFKIGASINAMESL